MNVNNNGGSIRGNDTASSEELLLMKAQPEYM